MTTPAFTPHQTKILGLMLRGFRLVYLPTSGLYKIQLAERSIPVKNITVWALTERGAIRARENVFDLTDSGRAFAEAASS